MLYFLAGVSSCFRCSSAPDRGSGAWFLSEGRSALLFACKRDVCSTGMSEAFAALRGFRRRWADPEPGPESALASALQPENALLSVTPDSASRSNGSFCLVRERRSLHLVQWVSDLLLILLGSSLATACRWANLSCGVHLCMAASGHLSG